MDKDTAIEGKEQGNSRCFLLGDHSHRQFRCRTEIILVGAGRLEHLAQTNVHRFLESILAEMVFAVQIALTSR
jgi:hypothetical protein